MPADQGYALQRFGYTSYLGWGVSTFVHGMILAAFTGFSLFWPQTEAVPQKAPFQWKVSLLAAPPTEAAVAEGLQASTDASPAESVFQTSPEAPPFEQSFEAAAVQESPASPSVALPPKTLAREADELPRAAIVSAANSANSPVPPPEMEHPFDSSRLEVETHIDSPTVLQRPQSVSRPIVTRSTVPDYTWLMDALRTKLERVKVYPASARANELQGRVVVQVSIHGDGRMTNSEIEESSGHPVLDQAALDTLRAASPLELKHVVEGPPLVMSVPLNYQLE